MEKAVTAPHGTLEVTDTRLHYRDKKLSFTFIISPLEEQREFILFF